jgi:transcription elongation factor GreA
MNNIKYITIEGLEKLKKELNDLKTVKRRKLAKRLEEAISQGDLSENFAYQQAKEDQNFLESRIIELKNLIKESQIIKKQKQTDRVQVGSIISTESDNKEKFQFEIVGSEETNPAQNKISFESPLGKAFLNKMVGETAEINTPRGKSSYKILGIK